MVFLLITFPFMVFIRFYLIRTPLSARVTLVSALPADPAAGRLALVVPVPRDLRVLLFGR
jgi:hypothetical protein